MWVRTACNIFGDLPKPIVMRVAIVGLQLQYGSLHSFETVIWAKPHVEEAVGKGLRPLLSIQEIIR